MKIRVLLIVAFTALFALPALANGPMPGDPGTSSSTSVQPNNMSPGRQRWTKRRMKHLRQQMTDYKKAQQTADALGYATGEYVPQLHRNPAEVRRHMINRYEFLALKAERGKASANDVAEMRALQSALLGR
jgi:hypothetical protein